MYNETEEVMARVNEEERDRINFESENFNLQPKKSWWDLEEELDNASTIEDILSPEEIQRWRSKGLLTEAQAQDHLKKWSERN